MVLSGTPSHPFDLALFGDFLFWTDWVRRGIGRAEKRSGRGATFIRRDVPQPMGIVAISRDASACELGSCVSSVTMTSIPFRRF